jgi:hypothetical protein
MKQKPSNIESCTSNEPCSDVFEMRVSGRQIRASWGQSIERELPQTVFRVNQKQLQNMTI